MHNTAKSLRGVRVLIVEDEALIAEELRERLSRLGVEVVDVVDTGPAAQRSAEQHRPDLVLMDIRLKGPMTGIEASEAIRGRLQIPIIFLTAHSDWETVLRAKRSDPFGYVLKPFQESDLVGTLEVALHRHSLERQLMERERWFSATLSSIGEGVIATDAEGIVTFLNPVAEALTQWSISDAIGLVIAEVFPLVDEGAGLPFENPVLQALRLRRIAHPDESAVLITHRGERTPVDISVAPIFAIRDHDKLLGAVVSFRDITQRKYAEEILRGSEERYRLLADNSSDTIWVMGLDGKFTYASPAVTNLCGYTQEEAIHIPLQDFLTPDSVSLIHSIIAAALSPAARPWTNRVVELELKRKDATTVWVESSIRAVRDAHGDVIALQGSTRDISERKQTVSKLKESEKRFRAIFDQTFQFIGLLTTEGAVVKANRTALEFAGIEETDVLGKPFWQTPWWTHSMALQHQLRDAIEAAAAGRFVRLEVTHPGPDGRIHTVDFSLKPVRDDEAGITLLIAEGRDITERKQAEDMLRQSEQERLRLEAQFLQAQKLEAVGRLAAGVAHDFNNLLTVINGYAEMLLTNKDVETKSRQMLSEVKAAGIRANRLTSQLLAFSRKQVMKPTIVDFGKLITESGRMLERLLGEDVVLMTSSAPGLWPVRVDQGMIEQVIVNLAVNARDAMPLGGRLTIETSNVEISDGNGHATFELAPGRWVRLVVSDTGVGMDQATQQRVFEPFFTTKEQGKGTGLGLATVYGIVKQSDGVIQLESTVGKGSTFQLYFPAQVAASPTMAATAAEVMPRGIGTILVVEDDRGVRTLLSSLLHQCGYTVYEAASGEEAISLFMKETDAIQLVLTDVVMPGMTGRELAEKVRMLKPAVRLLFMSGYTDDAVMRRGILQGKVNFLQKPFTTTMLAEKVRDLLSA